MLNVYHLVRLVSADWDEAEALVVVAPTEERARQLASTHPDEANGSEWLEPLKSSCTQIDLNIEKVLLGDYGDRS